MAHDETRSNSFIWYGANTGHTKETGSGARHYDTSRFAMAGRADYANLRQGSWGETQEEDKGK